MEPITQVNVLTSYGATYIPLWDDQFDTFGYVKGIHGPESRILGFEDLTSNKVYYLIAAYGP